MANQKGRGGYPHLFRQMAVARLKAGENLEALARELKVNRRSLYRWRGQADPANCEQESPLSEPELRQRVERLSKLVAEKTLEADFFKSALQKVEARRQRRESSGEKASTTRSGK